MLSVVTLCYRSLHAEHYAIDRYTLGSMLSVVTRWALCYRSLHAEVHRRVDALEHRLEDERHGRHLQHRAAAENTPRGNTCCISGDPSAYDHASALGAKGEPRAAWTAHLQRERLVGQVVGRLPVPSSTA